MPHLWGLNKCAEWQPQNLYLASFLKRALKPPQQELSPLTLLESLPLDWLKHQERELLGVTLVSGVQHC